MLEHKTDVSDFTKWVIDVVAVPIMLSIGTGVYTGFLVGRIVGFQNELQRARERTLTLPDRLGKMIGIANEDLAMMEVAGFYLDISHSLKTFHRQPTAGAHLSRASLAIQDAMCGLWRGTRIYQVDDDTTVAQRVADQLQRSKKLMEFALEEIDLIKPDWAVLVLGSWSPRYAGEREQGI